MRCSTASARASSSRCSGTTTGAPAALAVEVDVAYDDLLVTAPVQASQTGITSFGGALPWAVANPPCGASACRVFNQFVGTSPLPPDPDIEIGTLVLTAAAPGVLVLTTGAFGPVWWFGAPPPPDVTVTIVPEPTTLALLTLGVSLLGLARRQPSARRV